LVVRINAPDGEWQRYTFGNSYRYNEGKLRRIERGNSETEVLETEEIEYELAQSGLPYSAAVGTSLRTRGDGFADAYVRPRIQSVISRQGATFSWQATTFDAFARVTAETHTSSLGHTRSITQTFEDLLDPWIVGLPRVRSVNGLAERDLRYNAAALVEHEYRFGERRVSFGYRPDGTIQTVTDGRNFVTEANDWKRGLPQEVVYPSATGVRRATVDDNGWVRTITDETVEANVRTYDYDPLGRITDIDYPAGWAPTDRDFAPLQSDEYGIPAGSWKQTIATGNYRKHVWFDALWRPILEREWDATDPAGTQRFVRRGYDLRFNENFVSFAASSIGTITDLSAGTTTQFDRLNRRTTVSTPSELGVLTTSYAYETGFETRVTNARGYTQLIRYQAFDRPTEDYPTYVGSGLNGVPAEQSFTTITRDAWGKVLTMRRTGNGADATRSYLYDARQRLCQLTEPESGALVMDYDAAGNLWWSAEGRAPAATCDAARAVPPASRIIRVWHPRNWLSQIDYPEVSGLPSADTYYEYWPDGAVKQVSTEGSTRRYEYNTVRALDLETVEIGQGLDRPGVSQLTSVRSFVFDWQHDAQGAVSGLVYPGANGGAAYTTNFAPNALGQPTQVGSLVSGAVWHPDGQSAGWVYGNGITRTQTVNDRRLPLQVRETTAGGAVVFDETQLYDANANVMNVIDARDSAYNRLLDYDAQDRLRSASGVWGAGTFSFDGADNLLTQTIGAKSYSYAYSSQKLTAITGAGGTSIAFAHDGRGNVLQKGTAQYVWDVANRLVRTGDQLYRYDGHGRRTVAATVDALGQPVGASTLTIYSRDGQLLYEERIGANVPAGQIFANGFEPGAAAGESVTLTYHWLGKALVARRETRGAQVGTVWLTTDVLGSVVAETGPTAAVLNRTHYQPFGIPNQPRTGPGYTGHVMDIGTGLVYMQGRYYDADVGRFLSMDPVAPSAVDGADFNRYAYARNNPYRYTDPDGHAIETGWDIANIAIGVVSFGTNVAAGNWGAAAVDAAGVVVDAVATAVPGMPGGAGSVIKAARAADAAVEAGQAGRVADVGADAGSAAASPLARGRESEARVLADMGLSKNGQSVSTDEGLSIPDGLTEVRSVEIKDAQRVPLTKQLRIQTDAARESGRTSTLVTGESTCVSGPCAEAFDEVIRRPDLGPRNK
jgi:RHS repeat-associated protein